MLARFFKPKWQHSKPGIRLKAVAKLNANTPDGSDTLCQLALQDRDERVRLAATEKLHTLPVLLKISRRESIDSVRQQALHRISQLLLKPDADQSAEERINIIQQIQDNDLLCHITLNSTEQTVARHTLKHLRSDQHLYTIACQSGRASLRIQAAEQLTSPELLEQLNKDARSKDKRVFQITRDKLQQFREAAKQQQDAQQKITDLLTQLKQLTSATFCELYCAKLKVLQQDWPALQCYANSEEKVLFLRLQQQCQSRVDKVAHAAAQKAAQQQAETQQKRALMQLNEQLEDFLQRLCSAEIRPSNLEFLAAEFDLLKHASPTDLSQDLATKQSHIQRLLDRWQHYLDSQPELQQQIDNLPDTELEKLPDAVKKCHKLMQQLSWPNELSTAPLLDELSGAIQVAESQLGTLRQEQQDQIKRLENNLKQVDDSFATGQVKEAAKLLHKTERLLNSLPRVPGNLELRFKQLSDTLSEQQDWQAFAVTPKKLALCDEMESLIDAAELDPESRARKIRDLQQRWKILDADDPLHDQQIWKRFKRAADRAYAPCSAYFAEQREIRNQNLQLRQQICDELDAVVDGSSALPDSFKQLINNAKQRWRKASPVDRAPGKQIQQRFNQLLEQLQERAGQANQHILQAKQQLVEQSAQLLTQADLHCAATAAKQLQQEWKALGAAPRRQEQPLWQSFRENCNRIFQQLQQDTTEHDRLDSLITELEALQQQPQSLASMQHWLAQAQQAQQQPDAKTRHQQIDTAVAFIQQQHDAVQEFNRTDYSSLRHNAQLCEQLEDLLLEGDAEQSADLLQGWQSMAALPEALQQGMEQRRSTLLQLTEQPETLETTLARQDDRLRELCIRLEIACQQTTPAEDQPRRMEYQLQRLQHSLESHQPYTLAAILSLEYEWLCEPFCNHFEYLQDRFFALLDPLLELPQSDQHAVVSAQF
ncbi:DUF349 domain-containing protein [Pontibacter sp. JAM-7]|uniref:DUF349 domain-containing protein n=1 Tax=Pontibacter sp. JAM-7 TaxID=3366581 RepID=UPI003AF964A8